MGADKTSNSRPKVTVYITCHNYGRYVAQAMESVYSQLADDWELLVFDDGSEDDSWTVIEKVAQQNPDKVRLFRNETAQGLPACANHAIDEARGEYLIRLDADDYFDESALLTMSSFLDKNPDIALVYPNYIYVDEHGRYLGVEQRKQIGKDAKVMDLPAHGACTMVRKRAMKSVGGYSLDHRAQDGHEIWLNMLNRFQVGNIATPLFFYRQHDTSLTRDNDRVLNARRNIKRAAAKKYEGNIRNRVVGVIPAKNTYAKMPDICMSEIAGKPLIDYVVEAAINSRSLDQVLVSSDDQNVLDHCGRFPGVITNLRPIELSSSQVKLIDVMNDAVRYLEQDCEIYPDALAVLNVHTPLITPDYIDEAVDTLELYNVDSVTSVYEDFDLHFVHGEYGLEPLNSGAMNQLQLEREALYVDNNTLKVIWRDVLSGENLFGRTYGHIVMPRNRSIMLTDPTSRWMIEETIRRQ